MAFLGFCRNVKIMLFFAQFQLGLVPVSCVTLFWD